MILAIDIGNTTIGIGGFMEDKLSFYEKISSTDIATDLEYIEKLNTVFETHGLSVEMLEGSILSSVVPRLTGTFESILKRWSQKPVLLLSHTLHLGMDLQVDFPEKVGCDRLADAVGAITQYPLPLITIDMGTATTINVIDEHAHFLGGIIMPGISTAHRALVGNTAQLYDTGISPPHSPIGRNTAECINNGLIYGNACALDGLIQRINQELHAECTVVATGGHAPEVIPYCQTDIIPDSLLLMKGLYEIYKKNSTDI